MEKYYLKLNTIKEGVKHELLINKSEHYIDIDYMIYYENDRKKTNSFTLAGVTSGPINDRDIKSIINNIKKMFKGDVTDEFVISLNEYSNAKYVDANRLMRAKTKVKK